MTNASAGACIALGITWAAVGLPTSAWATSCDQATDLVAQSCARDADSDKLLAAAACANVGDPSKAASCLARADEELHSAQDLCAAQA